jgi:hypothetical protein
VTAALLRILPQVDVVVLAQASMARVVDALPAGTVTVPVLTSPASAMDRLAASLTGA